MNYESHLYCPSCHNDDNPDNWCDEYKLWRAIYIDMTIKPTTGNLLCKPITNKTESGLIMVSTGDERKRPEIAEVVEVGPGSTYKIGTRIVFKKYMDYKLTLGDVPCVFVEEKDILASYE